MGLSAEGFASQPEIDRAYRHPREEAGKDGFIIAGEVELVYHNAELKRQVEGHLEALSSSSHSRLRRLRGGEIFVSSASPFYHAAECH